MYSLQEDHQNDAVLFSVHHIRRHRMSDHPIIDGINLDHLDKFVSASLHHKVTISFFVINEYFVENTMRLCQYLFFIKSPPIH